MTETRANTLLLMLMAIIILLMIAIAGLFLRMNQLQRELLAAVISRPSGTAAQEIGLPAGTIAPDFTLTDLTGKAVSLRDFAGKQRLLVFSSVTCPACQKMYPGLKAFSEARRDLQVVMISRGTTTENKELMLKQQLDFPILTWREDVSQAYKEPGTPFFYLIDEQGTILTSGFANTQTDLMLLFGEK